MTRKDGVFESERTGATPKPVYHHASTTIVLGGWASRRPLEARAITSLSKTKIGGLAAGGLKPLQDRPHSARVQLPGPQRRAVFGRSRGPARFDFDQRRAQYVLADLAGTR